MSSNKDVIFIHGAPGSGKSTVAKALHERLRGPLFEFGWIPEFRQKGEVFLTYDEEEQLSFENLVLVVRNYLQHGFRNIIITDLRDPVMHQAMRRFVRQNYLLVTLVIKDNEVLKQRVLSENRSSEFRDWKEALALNQLYQNRPLAKNEVRLDATSRTVDDLVGDIIYIIGNS